ncbi:MAG: Xaa-Pro peptidase family protein, partial [Candidatus Micrarchaeota archaeon]
MSERIARFFSKSNSDALVLVAGNRPDSNFLYLSGLPLDNSLLMYSRSGGASLFVNSINKNEAIREAGRFDVVAFKDKAELYKKASEFLSGCRSVALDMTSMNAKTYQRFKKRLKPKRFSDASGDLLSMRSAKEEGEISILKQSAKIARKIIGNLEIGPGMTEISVLRQLLIAAIEHDSTPSFDPIVLSGPNTAMPHGKPSKRKISNGDVVLIDFGVRHKWYCSDLTRCVFIGRCETEREQYLGLKGVFDTLVKEFRAGSTGSSIWGECNALMQESGFGKMIHSPGHGIGLDVHERPSLFKKSRDKLTSRTCFAIEPAFYIPGKYGLRHEDNFSICGKRMKLL